MQAALAIGGSGRVTRQIRDKAGQHDGISIVAEWATVTGVPVGTDEHIHTDLKKRVNGLLQRTPAHSCTTWTRSSTSQYTAS